MRRILLCASVLMAAQAFAAPRAMKNALINDRYQESEAEKNAREFKEAELPLPAFPDMNSEGWFDIYAGNTFNGQPRILLESITPAEDGSIRYILNARSSRGYDNLSAEGLFCAATTSFSKDASKRSSFKVYAYGDTVNKRWIPLRKGEWKSIGSILNDADPIHGVLYRSFCEDGKPSTAEGLRERIIQRAGDRNLTLRNLYK
ncbi:CNP1-like family protein [Neisseria montereyensis]|uniref:CNP1-like family protein n=1 Tax=Neisseria montereyensis TaxID=2973938 RepID=A0ABT2FC67_9NEIS|nr:CNP1-like family protein [Neisseria montereyensis]MCS4533756.1 CNP1-like family protein [Neisseria montereyensis]